MIKKHTHFLSFFLVLCVVLTGTVLPARAQLYSEIEAMTNTTDLGLHGGSACLMDAATGEILYEQNADEKLEPASVTKVMTLLLAMEALDEGRIALDTPITASTKAAGMGGSQIWLEYGEQLSFDDMLKAIVVVSANDCTVALAEHLAGSEEAFVAQMNARASQLGMTNTTFKNCSGLPEKGHVTTARDIALMTRELCRHETIFNYTTIWMDSLRGGEMGLSNTNKLIRFYPGATGMKTGFTSSAGYCLSATAARDDLELIATVMKSKTSEERFEDAKKLLDYGFANFSIFTAQRHEFPPLRVKGGKSESVRVGYEPVSVLLPKGRSGKVVETTELPDEVEAPVKKGDVIGKIVYSVDGETVGTADIFAVETVDKTSYADILSKIFKKFMMLK